MGERKGEKYHNSSRLTKTIMSSNNNNNDKLASLLKSMSGGDDCDRPACDDTKSALSAALQRVGMDGASSSSSSISKKQQQHQMENDEKNIQKNRYTACPPTRDEIGSSTWSLLHSMVCRYVHTCTLPSQHIPFTVADISTHTLNTNNWLTFTILIHIFTGSMVSN